MLGGEYIGNTNTNRVYRVNPIQSIILVLVTLTLRGGKDPWGLGGTKCSKDWRHMTVVRFNPSTTSRAELKIEQLW